MWLLVRRNYPVAGPCLYICSTPIGNLQDASFRLIECLRQVDVIAAEDTRHTRKLLTHFEIHPEELVSYHLHNQVARRADFKRWWEQGKTVAVVSDAGTPGISDPGDDLVKYAVSQGVQVIPIPGASAVLAAVTGSQIASQPFTFLGFPPRSKSALRDWLATYASMPTSLVMYEAPHRLTATLKVMAELFPERQVTIAKELTKLHETFIEGSVQEVLAHMVEHEPRGEHVIILGQADEGGQSDEEDSQASLEAAVRLVQDLMLNGKTHAEAVREAAKVTGAKRKQVYEVTLAVKEDLMGPR